MSSNDQHHFTTAGDSSDASCDNCGMLLAEWYKQPKQCISPNPEIHCGNAGDGILLTFKGGCRGKLTYKEAYRCTGCGGRFHKDCILEHFKLEEAHDWGRQEEREKLDALIRQDRRELLERLKDEIEGMQLPWPESVFSPVPTADWPKIAKLIKDNMGYPIDCVSADNMRHAWNIHKEDVLQHLTGLEEADHE